MGLLAEPRPSTISIETSMYQRMASGTRDQVLFGIMSALITKLLPGNSTVLSANWRGSREGDRAKQCTRQLSRTLRKEANHF